jgi:hypothetical protein
MVPQVAASLQGDEHQGVVLVLQGRGGHI